MNGHHQHGEQGIVEINIIPFVDIALVLLIIFMISTPALVYKQMQVSLPKAVSGQDVSHVTLSLYVMPDGSVRLDQKPITTAELKQLALGLEKDVPLDAIISADKSAPHGAVMEVADTLRSAGIAQVGFATLPKAAE